MKITDFLKKENCVTSLNGETKDDILRELTELVSSNESISNGDGVLTALLEREKLGSTGIGDNIAIPHAKFEGIDELVAAFGVSESGIEYNSVDDQPVELVFLLLANKNSSGKHLKALARVSRLLKNGAFRLQVKEAKSSSEIFKMIEEEDGKLD